MSYFGSSSRGSNRFEIISNKSPKIIIEDVDDVFSNLDFFQQDANFIGSYINKWLLNTCLNTLCGAYQLSTNGQALNFKTELNQLYLEAIEWLKNQGYEQSSIMSFDQLISKTKDVAHNSNSMFVDLSKGRRTESQYLAGVVVGSSGGELLKKFHSVLSA